MGRRSEESRGDIIGLPSNTGKSDGNRDRMLTRPIGESDRPPGGSAGKLLGSCARLFTAAQEAIEESGISDRKSLAGNTLEDPAVWIASPEKRRVVKTHFDWALLPYSEEARYIMVIRDPKDVCVSSYFFFARNGPSG